MMNNPGGDLASAAREMAKAKAKAEIREIMQEELHAAGVLKPKRYVLPLPETEHLSLGNHLQSYALLVNGKWLPREYNSDRDVELAYGGTVTQDDIDAAPEWVKALKPVEVTDHE